MMVNNLRLKRRLKMKVLHLPSNILICFKVATVNPAESSGNYKAKRN
jgi:hypothetical protein